MDVAQLVGLGDGPAGTRWRLRGGQVQLIGLSESYSQLHQLRELGEGPGTDALQSSVPRDEAGRSSRQQHQHRSLHPPSTHPPPTLNPAPAARRTHMSASCGRPAKAEELMVVSCSFSDTMLKVERRKAE